MPKLRVNTTEDLAQAVRRRHATPPSKPHAVNVLARWRERRLTRALARTPIRDLFAALRTLT